MPFLQREIAIMAKAKAIEGGERKEKEAQDAGYEFLELDSGDAVVL